MATWSRYSSTAVAVVACAETEEAAAAAAAAGAALDTAAKKKIPHQVCRHDEGYGLRTDSRYGTEYALEEVVTAGYRAAPPVASQSAGSVVRRLTHRPAGPSSRRAVVMALDEWTHCLWLWCLDQHPDHQHLLTGIYPSERVF